MPGRAIVSTGFSEAFQQLCGFLAIRDTRDAEELLRRLYLMCLYIWEGEQVDDARALSAIASELFGVKVDQQRSQRALDALLADGRVVLTGTGLSIASQLRNEIHERVRRAQDLEEAVRTEWGKELEAAFPGINPREGWLAVQAYLAGAFRRHGMQTIALLDPEADGGQGQQLSSMLASAVAEVFPVGDQEEARAAVSGFVANTSNSVTRSQYISQLADGTFNYFALTVSPEVADALKQELEPLTLFLDTNFLFGVLDLHSNPQVEVSHELLDAIKAHDLPITCCYHPSTAREFDRTVEFKRELLARRHWDRGMSRAIRDSRRLSGIELKYHEKNADVGIDVESFFRPYRHADALLAEERIEIADVAECSLTDRATVEADYKRFLDQRGRSKSHILISHDAEVLCAVRNLRSHAKSSLSAGALLITCDYWLYRFDWESSRRQGRNPCTVLPNLFWQLLRPYLPPDSSFDNSFAETFAIPEFRTLDSASAEAASKLTYVLAGYEHIPEATARRMLANDLLLGELRSAKTDEEFAAAVDSAIARENADLVRERDEMAAAAEKAAVERRAEDASVQKALAKERRDKEIAQHRAETLKKREAEARREGDLRRGQSEDEKEKRRQAEQTAAAKVAEADEAREKAATYGNIAAVAVGLLLAIVFEVVLHLTGWKWLLDHPNSYGLQAGIALLLFLMGWPIVRPHGWKSNKVFWGGAVLAIVIGLISLLGGSMTNQGG
jgi:hypothetical protein